MSPTKICRENRMSKEEVIRVCKLVVEKLSRTDRFKTETKKVMEFAMTHIMKNPTLFEGCTKPNLIAVFSSITRFCAMQELGERASKDIAKVSLFVAEVVQKQVCPARIRR